jgi:phosphoesterase RecJ-like protein
VRTDLEQAGRRLLQSEQVLVLTHERPDGDAIGSLLALTLALRGAGRRATPVLLEGLPGRFRFLPGAELVTRETLPGPALTVAVDCADRGRISARLGDGAPIHLNIDHHPTNTRFGEWNWIDERAAATCEILAELIPAWGLPLDRDVATNLMAGVVTDTLGFRTVSVTPRLLRTSANLVDLDVDLPGLYQRTLSSRSFFAARYWGAALTRLQKEGPLLWTSLTVEDRRASGYSGADDADLVNLLTTIEDADLVVLFVEQDKSRTKVSWRATPGINVAALATAFGGGGHELASGATLEGSLSEIQERVLASARQTLGERKAP